MVKTGTDKFVKMDFIQGITLEQTKTIMEDIFYVLYFNPWCAAGALAACIATVFCIIQSLRIRRTIKRADMSSEQEKESYVNKIRRMWTAKRMLLVAVLTLYAVSAIFSSLHRFVNVVYLERETDKGNKKDSPSLNSMTMNIPYKHLSPGMEYTVSYKDGNNLYCATFIPPARNGDLRVIAPQFSTDVHIKIRQSISSSDVSAINKTTDDIPYVSTVKERIASMPFRHYNGVICEGTDGNRMAASAAATLLICTIFTIISMLELLWFAFMISSYQEIMKTLMPYIYFSMFGCACCALFWEHPDRQATLIIYAFLLSSMILFDVTTEFPTKKKRG